MLIIQFQMILLILNKYVIFLIQQLMQAIYEFGHQQPTNPNFKHQLQHYQIQIDNLKKQKIALISKVQQLNEALRKKGISHLPAQNNNLQLYEKDKRIATLQQQNSKLRRLADKPDDLLIKRKDNFQIIAEKDQQIRNLKRMLHQMESKYDGRYFNEHKVKRDYEMLVKENQQLKNSLNMASIQNGKKQYQIDPRDLQSLKYKKQYEMLLKENKQLKQSLKQQHKIREKEGKFSLGYSTAFQTAQNQLKQTIAKNRQLQGRVRQLEVQLNSAYEGQRLNKLNSNQQPIKQEKMRKQPTRRIFDNFDKQENSQMNYEPQPSIQNIKNQSRVSQKSDKKSELDSTLKKTGRYQSFSINEIISRLSQTKVE